jgi:hypothetical protein
MSRASDELRGVGGLLIGCGAGGEGLVVRTRRFHMRMSTLSTDPTTTAAGA